jgi:hypothetical protein
MNLEDLFSVVPLTEAITKLPVPPGLVGSMNLFVESGIRTTTIALELRNGKITLVPNRRREPLVAPAG